MDNVLVPVDGSDNATRAVAWVAHALRGRPGARVHRVHVEPPVDAWEVSSHLSAAKIEEWQAAAAVRILEPAAGVLRHASIPVETHAAVGDIAPEIHAHERRLGCDMIVMGTRGLGPVKTLPLGSTAQKVIHLAEAPVTLVK